MNTVIGIDLGTQSLKVLFYDADRREVVATGTAPLDLHRAEGGVAEQHAEWWVRALREAMRQVDPEVRRSARSVAVSGQQHGFVAIDQANQVLSPVKLWCDTSTGQQCADISRDFGGFDACIREVGNPILAGYTALHPTVEINLVQVTDLAGQSLEAIPLGEGPDIIAWSHDQIARHAEMGLIQPVENWVDVDTMEAAYEPIAVQAVEYNGQFWGLPESLETITMIYNRARLTPDDLPGTTDELLEKARAWAADHPGETYLVYGARNDVQFAAPWVYGAGGFYATDLPSVGLETPGGLAGLELIASFREFLPEEMDYAQADLLFKDGMAPIIINGSWYLSDLVRVGVDYGLAPLPVISFTGQPAQPLVNVKCLLLAQGSAHPGIAIDVMRYYTSQDALAQMALASGIIPANREANARPDVAALPYVAPFVQQANLGVPKPSTMLMATI